MSLRNQADTNSYPQARHAHDPYPILRRYVDTNEIVPHSEFTIMQIAQTAGVLGLLSCPQSQGACR